jgi:hypothetical protein
LGEETHEQHVVAEVGLLHVAAVDVAQIGYLLEREE